MDRSASHSKIPYFATLVCSLIVCAFVAFVGISISKAVFDQVAVALWDPSLDSVANDIDHGSMGAPILSLLLIAGSILVMCAIVILVKALRSNRAIEKCKRNGTVHLEPNYDFAISRYLFVSVKVDLSRTDFSNYESDDFPIEKIQRLVEIKIRDTSIPVEVAKKLLSCSALKKVDLSNSALSDESASGLAELSGIEFVLDGVTGLGE